jgi:phosphoribosylanthranilate isomerase
MSWVKVCGLTRADAVAAALDAGANALGFVFSPSVRQLTPAQAAQLAAPARGRAECVAVTLHPDQALIDEILGAFKPDVLQTDLGDLAGLRLPATLACLPVLRGNASLHGIWPARLLFEGPRSGAGERSDWAEAAQLARLTKIILAGGLTAANVAAAIHTVHPYGVDASSGLESEPGLKSVAKISDFVSAARAAFRESTS